MKLDEFIKTNKIHKDTFIALYNKNMKWIICGTQDDTRLVEYMSFDVEQMSDKSSGCVICLRMTTYEQEMQVAYYRMKAEERVTVDVKRNRRRQQIVF